MLGCQDFCGYYDWTFQHLRRTFGQDALHRLWAEAIASAQQHYTNAGLAKGLRGLYETWVTTGEDEQCDWTFTLDEDRNVLRWDMYQCPSKGHLIQNDLFADEDYCDHCMGWIHSMLDRIGAEVMAHEHNHCGQCWGEMRIKGKPAQSLAGREGDITADARWQRGYLDRWQGKVKLPLLQGSPHDPVDVLTQWFADSDALTVLGRGPSARDGWTQDHLSGAVIVTDPTYVTRDVYDGQPRAVLIGDEPKALELVAERFLATPQNERPLLMHMYLPAAPMHAFARLELPRPVPVLPLLVRQGLYRHEPHAPYPTTGVFALLLASALGKHVTVAGIDLYQHDSGRAYLNDQHHPGWPAKHSEACDLRHIRFALERLGEQACIHPHLTSRLV
ncbi:MAG: hypothetical protein IT445_10220 [Phycisphaeraceae bacterium]|nr:hypothetical protein [Phycisphaeraceae bacterium]